MQLPFCKNCSTRHRFGECPGVDGAPHELNPLVKDVTPRRAAPRIGQQVGQAKPPPPKPKLIKHLAPRKEDRVSATLELDKNASPSAKQAFDKVAYQREYMRAKRAAKRKGQGA